MDYSDKIQIHADLHILKSHILGLEFANTVCIRLTYACNIQKWKK